MTNRTSKGQSWLPTTAVQVLAPPGDVEALVPTDRQTFLVRWVAATGAWSCTCPARTTCGHIAAVRLVVIVDPEPQAAVVTQETGIEVER